MVRSIVFAGGFLVAMLHGMPAARGLDHFKCYKLQQSSVPNVVLPDVTLVDPFGTTQARVISPYRFCNPVDKNMEGIGDPTAHLNCYTITTPGQPFRHQFVTVEDQFGEQHLTLFRPDSLCVPAEKDGVMSALNIDHFKCYRVERTIGSARGGTLNDVAAPPVRDGASAGAAR